MRLPHKLVVITPRQKYHPGFTIVELLIVIVVIAILAAITVIAYNGIQQRAKMSVQVQSLAQYAQAFNLYTVENGVSPYTGTSGTQVACVYAPPRYTDCAAAAAAQVGQPSRIDSAVTQDLAAKMKKYGVPPDAGPITYTNVSYATTTTPLTLDDGVSTYSGAYLYTLLPGEVNPCPTISGLNYLSRSYPSVVPEGTFTGCRYTFVTSSN